MTDLEQSRAWRASRLSEKRFRETGNPLYLWESIGACVATGLPLPSSAKAYLERVAKTLGGPPPQKMNLQSKFVLEALEFYSPGGRTVFSQRYLFERDLHLQRLTKTLNGSTRDQVLEELGRDPDSFKRQQRRKRTKLSKLCPSNELHKTKK